MVMAMQTKASNQKSVVADIDFDTEHTVFEALLPLSCYGCSAGIESGDYFTRRGDKAGRVAGMRYVFCLKCRPVIWSGKK